MKVNQIAETLNTVFGTITGGSAVVAEDLSNITDFGREITSTTQWGDNFDNYAKKIIDKVGLTLYNNKEFSRGGLGLMRYGGEFGSILEKIRVSIGDFEANKAWQLTEMGDGGDFSDIFKFAPVDLKATYYNKAVTFRKKISLPEYQLRSAFNSPREMVRLFAAIEMAIRSKFQVATNALERMTIADRVLKILDNSSSNCIDLLAGYTTATGKEAPSAATALSDPDFLRYASYTIGVTKTLMMEESGLYNEQDYITHSDSDMKMIFLTDFAKALESGLYSNTFHENFVRQTGYSEVGFWQGMGLRGDFLERSTIKGNASDKTSADSYTQEGIVACLFSPDACFISGEMPYTTALPNPDGDFTNYWHKFKASYYGDLAENFVYFCLGKGSKDGA